MKRGAGGWQQGNPPNTISLRADRPAPACLYLDGFGGLQRLLRRDPRLPLPQQLLDEIGDVPPCNRDVLDAASNHVTFCLGKEGKRPGEACEEVQEARAPGTESALPAQHHGVSRGHTVCGGLAQAWSRVRFR